jgi:hypothetical protein
MNDLDPTAPMTADEWQWMDRDLRVALTSLRATYALLLERGIEESALLAATGVVATETLAAVPHYRQELFEHFVQMLRAQFVERCFPSDG